MASGDELEDNSETRVSVASSSQKLADNRERVSLCLLSLSMSSLSEGWEEAEDEVVGPKMSTLGFCFCGTKKSGKSDGLNRLESQGSDEERVAPRSKKIFLLSEFSRLGLFHDRVQ